jgi:hypothetical protein
MPGSGVVTTCFSKSDLKDLQSSSIFSRYHTGSPFSDLQLDTRGTNFSLVTESTVLKLMLGHQAPGTLSDMLALLLGQTGHRLRIDVTAPFSDRETFREQVGI